MISGLWYALSIFDNSGAHMEEVGLNPFIQNVNIPFYNKQNSYVVIQLLA